MLHQTQNIAREPFYSTIDLVRELKYPHGTEGQFLKIKLGQRVKLKQILL